MALNFQNTYDGFADLNCTLDELALIKDIVAGTIENYEQVDPIARSINWDLMVGLKRLLATHDEVPLPLSRADIALLLKIIRETETIRFDGVQKSEHKALVEAFAQFSTLEIFETKETQEMLRRLSEGGR